MKRKIEIQHALLFILLTLAGSCSYYVNQSFRQNYNSFNEFVQDDPKETFIKVHDQAGKVAILQNWALDNEKDQISGEGKLYDMNRELIEEGEITISLQSIAIIETNDYSAITSKDGSRLAALGVMTGVNVGLTTLCIVNPKACFGSCPTFYEAGLSAEGRVIAEAFSSSVAPSLEKHDLDALRVRVNEPRFDIVMKNEALETHVVNQLAMVVVPARENEFIYHDNDGNFYGTGEVVTVTSASVDNLSITNTLKEADGKEYHSKTDARDLAAKEYILLEFETGTLTQPGLVLHFRQSLLTTYLFYNGLSWMGNEMGDYFAKMENDKQLANRLKFPFSALGGIKVQWFDVRKNRWKLVDEIHETGPIAVNEIIIPLEGYYPSERIKVRLELAKGAWGVDYAALADIQKAVTPFNIKPSEVISNGRADIKNLQAVTSDDADYLVAFPGDESTISFVWPDHDANRYQLFLYAKGYYLEWMREEWLQNKDPEKLRRLLRGDKTLMKDLAKDYKRVEDDMEFIFWNSKYQPIQ